MDKKVIIPTVCAALVAGSIITLILMPRHHNPMPNSMNNKPNGEFIVDGGPMMPPPHFMGPGGDRFGPGPMMGRPDIDKQIQLSDEQHEKLRNLDKNLHKDMKALRSEEDDLRDSYLEKMDAVLTSEQFRKIQKMRQDLRREMKKLQDKRENIMDKHRQSFESILTPEQRKMLENHNNEHKNIIHQGGEKSGVGHDVHHEKHQDTSAPKQNHDAKQKPEQHKPTNTKDKQQ